MCTVSFRNSMTCMNSVNSIVPLPAKINNRPWIDDPKAIETTILPYNVPICNQGPLHQGSRNECSFYPQKKYMPFTFLNFLSPSLSFVKLVNFFIQNDLSRDVLRSQGVNVFSCFKLVILCLPIISCFRWTFVVTHTLSTRPTHFLY